VRFILAAIPLLFLPAVGLPQAPVNLSSEQNLPAAPQPQSPPSQGPPGISPVRQVSATGSQTGANADISLSLKQAEALAVSNNPQISVARLTALASRQVTREVRSNLWPSATANLTGADSQPGSRVTAGSLNNPIIYQRAAGGVTVNQLITDFGRTNNLTASADLAAKAENQNAMATKEQILLAVDQAFYGALQAHAVTAVAQQTVTARQALVDQVNALFNSKLKSQLDLSFANVNLSQAKLLLLDAQNNESARFAELSAVLGYSDAQHFQLVENTSPPSQPPMDVNVLIAQALSLRPEILALGFEYRSNQKFQRAEHDLFLPTIQAVGVVGDTPVRDPVLSSWYGAVGVNIGIPLFNGFLYSARSREASLKTQATQERLLDLRNRISATESRAMCAPVGSTPMSRTRSLASHSSF
jgi:outer membrane protein